MTRAELLSYARVVHHQIGLLRFPLNDSGAFKRWLEAVIELLEREAEPPRCDWWIEPDGEPRRVCQRIAGHDGEHLEVPATPVTMAECLECHGEFPISEYDAHTCWAKQPDERRERRVQTTTDLIYEAAIEILVSRPYLGFSVALDCALEDYKRIESEVEKRTK